MSVLRNVLLALSESEGAQNLIAKVPVSHRMSRRFVAGETLDEAMAVVQQLNARGMTVTLDHLGEHVIHMEEAEGADREYVQALARIQEENAQSGISVKLTHLGLDIDEAFCFRNLEAVVERAAEASRFVRIDMESSDYIDKTLEFYRRVRSEFDNVGIVLQGYLKRTLADVQALIDEEIGDIRIVKGAYDEPPAIAYRDRQRINEEMEKVIALLLSDEARAKGALLAMGSHDSILINYTKRFAHEHNVPLNLFEFQMLYGIRRDLQAQLVQEGYRMRIYLPYGVAWYPYFMRRLAERPANLLFFLRALVGK